MSFVHAISTAGVMFTLTKNCSMGDFSKCGCDNSKVGQMGKFAPPKVLFITLTDHKFDLTRAVFGFRDYKCKSGLEGLQSALKYNRALYTKDTR